jgi:hypothetical protein
LQPATASRAATHFRSLSFRACSAPLTQAWRRKTGQRGLTPRWISLSVTIITDPGLHSYFLREPMCMTQFGIYPSSGYSLEKCKSLESKSGIIFPDEAV